MSAQLEEHQPRISVAQAPAMIALATQVSDPNEFQEISILHLKVGVSRYDIATVESRHDTENFVSFQDVTQTPIEYADIPHRDLSGVFRVIHTLRETLGRSRDISGVDITIEKNIPFGTRMGGTAATLASVLVALADVWDANMSKEDLTPVAKAIGPGVAEALSGGVVLTRRTATEELITPVLVQDEIAVVLVPAAADLDEELMSDTVKKLRKTQREPTERETVAFSDELLKAVAHGDTEQLALMMHNDFQPALLHLLPEHNDWLQAGMAAGASAAQTVADGASIVLVSQDPNDADRLAEQFQDELEIAAVPEYGPVTGAQLL